jgi:hypothetical protein
VAAWARPDWREIEDDEVAAFERATIRAARRRRVWMAQLMAFAGASAETQVGGRRPLARVHGPDARRGHFLSRATG